MHWVRYVWGVFVGLFNLIVILWVFGQLHEPRDRLFVSILGILYATIRSAALAQGIYASSQFLHINLRIFEIEKAVGSRPINPEAEADEDDPTSPAGAALVLRHAHVRAYIELVFIALVYLLCLYIAFTSLSRFRWVY